MNSSRICIHILFICTVHLHTMQRTHTETYTMINWDGIPDDIITTLAAHCEPNMRNRLMRVCKKFRFLASKENNVILQKDYLKLHTKDAQYYSMVGALTNNYNLVCNALDHGANIYQVDYLLNISPLFALCKTGNPDILNRVQMLNASNRVHQKISLISKNSISLRFDSESESYLSDSDATETMPSLYMCAVYTNNIYLVKKYICDDTVSNEHIASNDNTALHIAAALGHVGLIPILLTYDGVETHKNNGYGKSPLDLAIENNHIHTIKLLLPDTHLESSIAALSKAERYNALEIIKLLLAHHATLINVVDGHGRTMLHRAVIKKNIALIELLLTDKDIQINATDENGNTALHYSACKQDIRYTSKYKQLKSIAPNATTVKSESIYIIIINLLLTHPTINLQAKNNNQMTALQIAQKKGYSELIPLLSSQRQKTD
jgi:ankyrin repeat protein